MKTRYGKNAYALDETGVLIHISDVPDDVDERRAHTYTCPDCGREMVPKKGEYSAACFAHKAGTVCKGKPSAGDWKNGWKALFGDGWKHKTFKSTDEVSKTSADLFKEFDGGRTVSIVLKGSFTKKARFAEAVSVLEDNSDVVAWVFDVNGKDIKLRDGRLLSDRLPRCSEGDVLAIKWPTSKPVMLYWDEHETVASKDPSLYVYFHIGEPGDGWMLELVERDLDAVRVRLLRAKTWIAMAFKGDLDCAANTHEISIVRRGLTKRIKARIGASVSLPAGDPGAIDKSHGLRWRIEPGGFVYGAEKARDVIVKKRDLSYELERYEKPVS